MAKDSRYKNYNWNVDEAAQKWPSHVKIALLMDIRDTLQSIDAKLGCHRIPKALDAVARLDRRMAKKVKLP
jgi:hypothetical protein